MSDTRVRALLAAFQASGSVEDEAAWLAERLRNGTLEKANLEAASLLQYRPACLALGEEVSDLDSEELPQGLIDLLGLPVAVRAIVAMFRQPLPGPARSSLTRDRFTVEGPPPPLPKWALEAVNSWEATHGQMLELRRSGDEEGAEEIEDGFFDAEEELLDRAEEEGGDPLRNALEEALQVAGERAAVTALGIRRSELPAWAQQAADEFERLSRLSEASEDEDEALDEQLWSLREKGIERAKEEGIRREVKAVFQGVTDVVSDEFNRARMNESDEDGYRDEPHEAFLPFAPIVEALEAWCAEGTDLPDLEVPDTELTRFDFHLRDVLEAIRSEEGDVEEAFRESLYDFEDHGFDPYWAIQRDLVPWLLGPL